jgi:hypothetical protein
MRVLTMAARKGGAGKDTRAASIAVAASRAVKPRARAGADLESTVLPRGYRRPRRARRLLELRAPSGRLESYLKLPMPHACLLA